MTVWGYVRVSTQEQSLEVQLDALHKAGVDRKNVFQEKKSGANISGRQQFQKVMAKLAEGDTLVVTKLDRMARNVRELLSTIDAITAKGASFKSLAEDWADTTTPTGRLMLTVIGGIAEFERELIKQRCDEGRALAKAKGVKFGRKLKLSPHQRHEVVQRFTAGETRAQLARSFDVDYNTITLVLHKAEQREAA